MIILKAKGANVIFRLKNRSKYAFRNVVIADTVPAGLGFRRVAPKPSLKKANPNGSVYLEWRVSRMLPDEVKTFRYSIDRRKFFLPKAKIVRYDRIGEEPWWFLNRGQSKKKKGAQRGLFESLFGFRIKIIRESSPQP